MQWFPVKGFEGDYEVSEDGSIVRALFDAAALVRQCQKDCSGPSYEAQQQRQIRFKKSD